MTRVEDRFERAIAAAGLGPVAAVVAVSGGPDSIALLDLAVRAAPSLGLRLTVAHFDHGIQPDSAEVAGWVAAGAARYGVRYLTRRVELGAAATETAARRARLAWLEAVADETGAGFIMTGHHRDDQVETLIMRFLRGSGPAGLAGIQRRRGRWIRPLLDVPRAAIAEYLVSRGLTGWQDPSNGDQRHLRNWVRHQLLPRIELRLPRVRENLGAAAGVFGEQRDAWNDLLSELPGLQLRVEPDGVSVAADPLKGYSSAVVRSLLKALGFRLQCGLGKSQVDRLQRLVVKGHTGQVEDLFGGARAELAFGRLKLFRAPADLRGYRVPLAGPVATARIGDWQLTSTVGVAPPVIPRVGFETWVRQDAGLFVRPWHPGDRIRPIRGRGTRLVVRCMQDNKVPRSRRPMWPVFEHQGVVVWVPGVCRSDALLPEPAASAMRIDVRPR